MMYTVTVKHTSSHLDNLTGLTKRSEPMNFNVYVMLHLGFA